MFEVYYYVSGCGRKPVLEFLEAQDVETRQWIISGIKLLAEKEGKIGNQYIETKHVAGKIFELKFRKLPVRLLYSYHPDKRRVVLLLHGVIKKRDKLNIDDIRTAIERYNMVKERDTHEK